MTAVLDLPGTVIAAGATTLDALPVPDGTTVLTLSIARCTDATPANWPDAANGLIATLEVSYDGGASYGYGGGFTAIGGIALDAAGQQFPATRASYTYGAPVTHVRLGLNATADLQTDLTLSAA